MRTHLKRTAQVAVGAGVAILLMWLLFRGIEFDDLADALRSVDLIWLAVMQIPIWIAFFTRVQRWTYIVRAVHPASFRNLLIATQLMFLWNFTIGMRLGEFVRPVVLKRLENIPFSKGLALGTLDRVTDLVGLIAIVGITVFAFRPESDIVIPEGIFGLTSPITIPAGLIQAGSIAAIIGLFGLVALLVTLYLNQAFALRVTHRILRVGPNRFADLVCGMLEQFAQGLHVFRSSTDMLKSIVFSLITWAMFIVCMYCQLEAFGLDYPWYLPFVVQVLLAFSVSAPGTPGMLGQFHVPIVGGLLMVSPEIPIPTAVAFALVAHIVNVIPIVILGIYSLAAAQMGVGELARQSAEVEKEAEEAGHDVEIDEDIENEKKEAGSDV